MDFTKVQKGILSGKDNWETCKFKISILLRSQRNVMFVVKGKLQTHTANGGNATREEVTKYNADIYTITKADSLARVIITSNLSVYTLDKILVKISLICCHIIYNE